MNARPIVGHPNNTISAYDVSHQRRKVIQDDNVLGNDKARWMTSLAANLGSESHRVILADFVLPGSHNSAAVKVSDKFCSESMFPLPSLPTESRNKVAECQDISILDQLEAGIRYFDIRSRRCCRFVWFEVSSSSHLSNRRSSKHHGESIGNIFLFPRQQSRGVCDCSYQEYGM
jgi:hypothetical protein